MRFVEEFGDVEYDTVEERMESVRARLERCCGSFASTRFLDHSFFFLYSWRSDW